ncbi:MAG TPA: hypothetical protein VGG54_22695 [Trebonia sp.]|jgi:hypothetical protein
MTTPNGSLDLDAARADRARARAARQEGRGETLPIVIEGATITELPSEFPLTVLEPLTGVDVDLALIIRSVIQAAKANARDQQLAAAELLVNVLAANPQLFAQIIEAAKEMGRRLLGADGYAALVAWGPSWWDVADLAKGLMAWYGMSLGESSPSTRPSAEGSGETSAPISSPVTGSTPADAGNALASPVSSAPDGSSSFSPGYPTTA